MKAHRDAEYRIRLAESLLEEAKQDFELKRWRSCVSNAQQVVENSGKAVMSLFDPVEKTHDTEKQLSHLQKKGLIEKNLEKELKELISLSKELGSRVYIMAAYGDEERYIDPWQLFNRENAGEALEKAGRSVELAQKIYDFYKC